MTYVRDKAHGYCFKDEQSKEYGCTQRSTKAQTLCSPLKESFLSKELKYFPVI